MNNQTENATQRPADWLILFLAPLFFSTNLVFGRGISQDVAPFTLALVRWALSAAILAPFVLAHRQTVVVFIRQQTRLWLLLGFLGMWVCGGCVYWSLGHTTASNATLIYTTSSLFIILIERIFRGRSIQPRQIAGMLIAFAGVANIIVKGDLSVLMDFRFNLGDVGILVGAVAWAAYSVLMRTAGPAAIPTMPLFGITCLSGCLLLAPFSALEFFAGAPMPATQADWLKIGGIVLFSSLLAFSCFQHGIKVFGPALAGVFLYLMPPFSILLAVVFLGETFERHHLFGVLLVMGGVVLATFPVRRRSCPSP